MNIEERTKMLKIENHNMFDEMNSTLKEMKDEISSLILYQLYKKNALKAILLVTIANADTYSKFF